MDDVNGQTLGPERRTRGETLGGRSYPAEFTASIKIQANGSFCLESEDLNEQVVLSDQAQAGIGLVETTRGMAMISSDKLGSAAFSEQFIREALRTAREVGTQVVSIHVLPETVVEETGFRLAMTVFSHNDEGLISWQTVFGPSASFPSAVVEALLEGWQPNLDRFVQGRAGATGVVHAVFESIIVRGLAGHLSLEERSALLRPMLDLWTGLGQSSSSWPSEWSALLTTELTEEISPPNDRGTETYPRPLAGVIRLPALSQKLPQAA